MNNLPCVAILGAGPAGLMAALLLLESGRFRVQLIEAAPLIGGLCGTRQLDTPLGTFRFDYGGHRFLTRDAELLARMESLLGADLLHAKRSSVIRYQGRTYHYPLQLGNLLQTAPWSMLLGAGRDLLANLLSSAPLQDPATLSFADWTRTKFGTTLYEHFFAGYSRKLWGIEPTELSGDWADQRIARLDLREVARLLLPGRADAPRGYARHYRYPRLGFGQMFDALAREVRQLGGEIFSAHQVVALRRHPCHPRIAWIDTNRTSFAVDHVISTLPLPLLVQMLGGQSSLRYRGLRFLTLPLAGEQVSPHTWQYLSDPDMLATRLQEPKRRSPFMAPPGYTSLMLEIPCQPGDATWQQDDEQLTRRIWQDLVRLGISPKRDLGYRQSLYAPQAYPLMDRHYGKERLLNLEWVHSFSNLITCGRQGTFRYIFTDTAMEMGMLAARCLLEHQDYREQIYQHRNETHVIETDHLRHAGQLPPRQAQF